MNESRNSMTAVIEVEHVRKAYRDMVALDDLTLHVPRGAVYGLVGRNGAGKTTTLNLLIGLLSPDNGTVRIEGHDVHRQGRLARRTVAFVAEEAGVYPWLTGAEAARYWSRLSGTWNESAFRQCVARFDLPLTRRVAKLSKGMRTQLLLALAIGKQPSVYILDEPTSGLDPVVRRHVLHLLGDEVRTKGRTILLSSHVLSELDDICTHVAVLDRGRLKVDSELRQLRNQWRKYEFSCRDGVVDGLLRELGPAHYEKHDDAYTLMIGRDADRTLARLQALPLDGLRVAEMRLEEIFFHIIGSEPTADERVPPH